MFRSNSSDEEQALANRLRREATACRPEFSETLHRQLCRTVRRCEAAQSVADPISASPRLLRYGIPAAIVAAGVLIATVVAWQTIRDDHTPDRVMNPSLADAGVAVGPPATAAPTPAELEMVGNLAARTTEQIGILVESAGTQRHWAFLDQNAKLAMEALNDRVPLDAVASLVFADVSSDSRRESPDQ